MATQEKPRRPENPIGYHAYIKVLDNHGKDRSCFLASHDDTAWRCGEALVTSLQLGGHWAKVHRWRGPLPSPHDPRAGDMYPNDDMPW